MDEHGKLVYFSFDVFHSFLYHVNFPPFSGILTQIQDHFGVNDSMAGLLQTVFIISYMIFAPLFGFLGDRYSRKWIMAMGVFLWSLTTLLGSFMEVGEVADCECYLDLMRDSLLIMDVSN